MGHNFRANFIGGYKYYEETTNMLLIISLVNFINMYVSILHKHELECISWCNCLHLTEGLVW